MSVKIDAMRVAKILRSFNGRVVRPSTVARAMADDFERVGVGREEFIRMSGATRARPNQRSHPNGEKQSQQKAP